MTPPINPKKHLQLFIENQRATVSGDIDSGLDIPRFTLDERGFPLKQVNSCPSIQRC